MTIANLANAGAIGLLLLALVVFIYQRGLTYLMFFQQEEYDRRRFMVWLKQTKARDRTTSLIAIVAGVVGFGATYGQAWTAPVASLILLIGMIEGIRRSILPRRHAKKALVMTKRARRILAVYMAFSITLCAALGLVASQWQTVQSGAVLLIILMVLILAQSAPYLLSAANSALSPLESRVKKRFLTEAKDKLARLDPYVIGITGSYGKTSTKSILAHILSGAAPTLATPGSVNTEMGITRIIREQLTPDHRYFIVEMGAYGPGSIARLCRLTPPSTGIITAIGWAHYERFKSEQTVFDAKFELADAVTAAGGTLVINQDAISQDMLSTRTGRTGETYLTIGRGEQASLRLLDVTQTVDGLTLKVKSNDLGITELRAPLYGTHQAMNILAATALGMQLGLSIDAIRAALASVPQARHRLEVTERGGITIIDDAYNANPSGFASGLELLDVLRKPTEGRRILISPGMVELGARHDEEHARIGEIAARHVDIALIVTPDRIETFVEAFLAHKPDSAILMRFDRQADAENWIKANARSGDAILYENNLPDLYEAHPVF